MVNRKPRDRDLVASGVDGCEISKATHLMRKGWDLEFADYSGIARFDFLARQGSTEIEVEYKATSGDTGRKIHRQEVSRLADLILPTSEQLIDAPGCHCILITVPHWLGKSANDLSLIASTVVAAVQKTSPESNDLVRVEYTLDNVQQWPNPLRDAGARHIK
jgi:hypothetical protein